MRVNGMAIPSSTWSIAMLSKKLPRYISIGIGLSVLGWLLLGNLNSASPYGAFYTERQEYLLKEFPKCATEVEGRHQEIKVGLFSSEEVLRVSNECRAAIESFKPVSHHRVSTSFTAE